MTKRKSKAPKSTVKATATKGVRPKILHPSCHDLHASADRPWL